MCREERGIPKKVRGEKMSDLTKEDIGWLEGHGFKMDYMAACYKRKVGNEQLSVYYSVTFKVVVCICVGYVSWHGEGRTAEDAFIDFLHKNKTHIEELQSCQNELVKI